MNKQLELASYDDTLQYMLTVVTYGDTWQALMPRGGHISPTRRKDMAATYLQQDTRTYGDTQGAVEHSASHNGMWWHTHRGTLDDTWRRLSIQCYGELWRCIRGKLHCNKCVNFEGVRKDDEAGRYVAGSYNTLLYRD